MLLETPNTGEALAPQNLLRSQERPLIVELAGLSLGPLVELGDIYQDLAVGRDFHVRSMVRPVFRLRTRTRLNA